MQVAQQHGASQLQVVCDSPVVVRQVSSTPWLQLVLQQARRQEECSLATDRLRPQLQQPPPAARPGTADRGGAGSLLPLAHDMLQQLQQVRVEKVDR